MHIAELVKAFRDKKCSPVEILQEQLAQIRTNNPTVNALAHFDEEGSLKRAFASQERWLRGEALGPLDGVTFTAKDNLQVEGYPSRRGSLATSNEPMKESSPIVARCLEVGAVLLGTTTIPEFAMAAATISPLTGITRNPRDTSRQAGGSSGGAAAAVAAGFCSFALASDAGGSIRIPASLCGVVGFKPTNGRIPMFPMGVSGALSSNGPITNSVEDAALVLNCATRPDVRDPFALSPDGTDYVNALSGGIRGSRVALSVSMGYAKKVHPEIKQAVLAAREVLEDLGAIVKERDPGIEDPVDTYVTLQRSTGRHSLTGLNEAQRALLAPATRGLLESSETSLGEYLAAQEQLQALARHMHGFHQNFDLLVTPTVAAPAFAADRFFPEEYEEFSNRRAWLPFTLPFNLTRQPAISIPIGVTTCGLPIGLQIVAAYGNDAVVLRAAAAFANRIRQS